MSNLIGFQNLNDLPAFSIGRIIGVSAINILNAGILANDNAECVAESRRIYKHGRNWQSIKSNAKKLIQNCEKNGISVQNPYKVETENLVTAGWITKFKNMIVVHGTDLIVIKSWKIK